MPITRAQETIPAFQDGNWHASLLPLPRYMATYPPEYHMAILRCLQTSSVAVVKDCIHTVDVHMAEDLFACPWLLVSALLKHRAQRALHYTLRGRAVAPNYTLIVNLFGVSTTKCTRQSGPRGQGTVPEDVDKHFGGCVYYPNCLS